MISVIIPTLNEEKLLPALLRQFTQELRKRHDLEIIVSDGGSTDGTLAIAESFGSVTVQNDAGTRQTIAGGRNAGGAMAQGNVLVFINGDVRIEDIDSFFHAIGSAFLPPDVVAATCEVQVFPEEEKCIDKAFHFVHNGYVRFLNFVGEGMGRGECQILPKDIFERVGGYNADMVAGEDYDLFRRVRRLGSIVMLPGITVYESPRRFRKYGYFPIIWGWTKNALAVIFRKKSSSKEWEAVR